MKTIFAPITLGLLALFVTSSLWADAPAPKPVTLFFKSYEPGDSLHTYIFYVTSSEVPVETGDWHPGMVDKGYKIGDMIGSYRILKFVPMATRGMQDPFGADKSVLVLVNGAKPSEKIKLILGETVTIPAK